MSLSMTTRLRVAVGGSFLLLPLPEHRFLTALPWVLAIIILDVLAERLLGRLQPHQAGRSIAEGHAAADTRPNRAKRMLWRRQAFIIVCLEAAIAGAAMGRGGTWSLYVVLLPALHAGQEFLRRGVAWVATITAVFAYGATIWWGVLTEVVAELVLVAILVAILVGVLAAWAQESQAAKSRTVSLTGEAGALLRRLHELAETLDTGFDAPGSAEMALQDLSTRMRAARSAILVGYGVSPAVPLAIRGVDRTPWPDPTEPGSVLAAAWEDLVPTLDVWDGDAIQRSVIAVPLRDERGERLGVLVADRPAATPFTEDDLESANEVAEAHAASIDLSVLFASLRERSSLEERERLAREMHDGVAQELVALGFGIDTLRHGANDRDPDLARGLDEIRADISRILGDLRLQIGDLRIGVRPDAGLGALIGARLQNVGTMTGVTTRMHLSETGFRLPAHTEVLIYRLFLAVIADARHAANAQAIDVSLNVAAPRAELWVSHDGTSTLEPKDFESHPLRALGADISVERYARRGVSVRMRMRARGASPSATLSHERIPHPS
jgi:signal transduction histidine kinase